MIAAHNVFVRDASAELIGVTVVAPTGVHAIVGQVADGAGLLLSVLAGVTRPSRGQVTTDRRTVAFVPLDADLPEFLSVTEVLEMAAEARGEPLRPAATILDAVGVASLAPLRVRALSPGERRAVLLAEAIASTVVTGVLIHEPFFLLDPRAAVLVARALASRGGETIFATSSTREAATLATSYTVLARGRVIHQGASLDGLSLEGSGNARFRVAVDTPASLVGALATDTSLRVETRAGFIIVEGSSAEATARAINDAIVGSGVNVTELVPEPLPLEELRATAHGKLAAAFQAAVTRAQAPR